MPVCNYTPRTGGQGGAGGKRANPGSDRHREQPAGVTRVRLVGIDAPDLQQQPWGPAAKERLEAMIGGGSVLLELDVQDKDSFGGFAESKYD